MKNTFNREDKESLVTFLNIVAAKAQFTMNTSDIIKFFKLLQYVQTVILPKIDDNMLEVIAVHEENDVPNN